MFKDPLKPYGNAFKIVPGDNDQGRPCRDCAITGKCFCIGEKGNRVSILRFIMNMITKNSN